MPRKTPYADLLLRSAVALALGLSPVFGGVLRSVLGDAEGHGVGLQSSGYLHAHGEGEAPHWHPIEFRAAERMIEPEGGSPVVSAGSAAPHDHLVEAASPSLTGSLWSNAGQQFEGLACLRLLVDPAPGPRTVWRAVGPRGPPRV